MSEVLIEVRPSPARRWFACAVMWLLAFMLVWLALMQPPTLPWQVFLLLIGAASAWAGEALRRATLNSVVLTEEGVRDSAGRVIAPMAAIRRVDRGAFAFKPSSGFLLVLDRSVGPRAWAPGLWWRLGRRVGVGGVTPSHAAKAMAEEIALRIAARD